VLGGKRSSTGFADSPFDIFQIFLLAYKLTMNSVDSRESKSVRVNIARREDAEKITAVINSAFRGAEQFFVEGDRVDVGEVLNFLETGKFLLAESENTLLGCVYVEPRHLDNNRSSAQSQDRAYLGLLAVAPAHQQSGLGSMLMDAAEDYCRAIGLRVVDIKVVNLREELAGFYRKRGYVETGTSAFPTEVETKRPCHFIDMSKPLDA
jgi:ribosomal protein S18 acetylase RimI-like enzyme